MSIESITERIRNDAIAYSVEQKAEAEAVRQTTLDDANNKAKEIRAEYLAKAEEDAAKLLQRRASVADLEARKMQLAAKQEVINESFEKALEKIQNLNADERINFIKDQITPFADEAGQVMLSAADKTEIGERLAAELAGTKLTIAEEPADIRGGCILKRGDVYINASIEKLIEGVKAELTSEIAGILFK